MIRKEEPEELETGEATIMEDILMRFPLIEIVSCGPGTKPMTPSSGDHPSMSEPQRRALWQSIESAIAFAIEAGVKQGREDQKQDQAAIDWLNDSRNDEGKI